MEKLTFEAKNYYNAFIEENPTFVGTSEGAMRPLIGEQDKEVKEAGISHVEKRLKRETPTGGVYEKLTAEDVKLVIDKERGM